MAATFPIIRNGILVDPRRRASAPVDILIDGDTIITIGARGMDAPQDAVPVDASDRAMMPGMVNGHVHGHGTLAKGLVGDRWPLELFLNAMPGMAGNRTLEDKYLNGLVAAVEMIRKGCTACYDLFFEFPLPSREGVLALGQAYRDAGASARSSLRWLRTICPFYQAYPGLIDALPMALQADARAFKLAPHRATADAAEKIYADWPFDEIRFVPRSRRPSRSTAVTSFSYVAAIWRRPTNCRFRPISPRRRRKPCLSCANTARR